MLEKIKVKVFRFDPSTNKKYCKTYNVPLPLQQGLSVLDVLDYIYENLDPSLSYYDHAACRHGICSGCILVINGKTSLACQTPVSGDITVNPPLKFKIVKDLVYSRARASAPNRK